MFIVLSLFALGLFLGAYVPASFGRLKGPLLERVALTLGVGLLINYCLMLAGLSIARTFLVGALVASWGAVGLLRDVRTREVGPTEGAPRAWPLVLVGYLIGIFYVEILSEPLQHWDARAIWFFHAKMIWVEGALREQAGWAHPSLAFSHPDYPKLLPSAAAQVAYLKGYWNEFLPKGALLLLLLPLIFWIVSCWKRRPSFILLLLLFFFSLDAWLSNGYMDGYLALYAGVALLFFGRYSTESREIHLYSGTCALGICAGLKNEGLLFALSLAAAVFIVRPRGGEYSVTQWTRRLRQDPVFLRILTIAIAPTLMWTACKTAWGLHNDIAGEPWAGLARLSGRLSDGVSPQYVLEFLTVRATTIWGLAAVFAVTLLFLLHHRLKVDRVPLVAATTAVLYVCGLWAAYLSTPLDLTFHLTTSATRTMAPANMAFLVGIFFLLSDLEVKDEVTSSATSAYEYAASAHAARGAEA